MVLPFLSCCTIMTTKKRQAGDVVKYKKGKLWKIPTLVVCAVLFGLLAADISGSYVTAPIDVAAYHILRSFESSAATGFSK